VHVGTNEDFYDLANAMGGELRSSHLNVTGPASYVIEPTYITRFLGFELEKSGGAYRISHIYREGPADKEWLDLALGDLVLAIDGEPLAPGDNYWKTLSEKNTQYVPVKIAKSADAEPRTVRIATVTDLNDIRYNDWVLRNRELVEKKSGGRIAYAHIRQMNPESLTKFQSDVERDWTKDGIIVDVRYNSGGNIDEQILEILRRQPYMCVNPRNGSPVWGRRPGRAIAGPKVMLINQRSFSDAEATPMGFRTLGLGRLVGTPTSGGVIWTNTYNLLNGATMRVPNSLAAVYDATKPNGYGINLENYGVPPDVWVQNSLEDERKHIDRELEAAIDEVMRTLKPAVSP
jgi:tricorn protease